MNFILKYKKKLKFILYLVSLFILFSVIYLSTPKLVNFPLESLKKNLKNNNDINISNISKVDYKIFPSPRLIIPNSNFTIGEGIVEVSNSELEIILVVSKILNFKEVNYKKLRINKGFSKINLNNVPQFLTSVDKNKKKLIFKNNNLIFLQEKNVFFKINDALIKIQQFDKKKELNINGNFLNNKIFIKLDNTLKNKNKLKLEIPELDIAASIFFEKNKSGYVNGIFNLEIFNNFLKFDFIKDNNIKLTNGFIRSKLANSAIEGEVAFNPNFFSLLDFKISNLNMKKLLPLIQKNYFSENVNNIPLIKKINGIFNFTSKFEGKITNRNGDILFEDFKVGKNKSYYFNAKIIELNKKRKIQFNLVKTIKYKKNLSKKIEIKGFIIPSNSKVIFKNFLIDGNKLSTQKTKEYENKFKEELIQDHLGNIFSEKKMDRYLKNLF